MRDVLLVFLGSGLGGAARHLLSSAVNKLPSPAPFPVGILAVNILASLLAGLLAAGAASRLPLDDTRRLLLVAGFCGGFSTLSALTQQTLALWRDGHPAASAAYLLATLAACLAANTAGILLVAKHA
ncbi:MAG: CrcB family protein [Opitutaceae bacterium]|jgi:CrcB protein|nr:CrcB family protein [Opitutaceae bacterium]